MGSQPGNEGQQWKPQRRRAGEAKVVVVGQAVPGFDLKGPTRSLLTWGGMSHVKGKSDQRSRQGWAGWG